MSRICNNPGCGNHLPGGGAAVIEPHRYGYCSWNCLEAADPELARQLKEKSEASQKAAIAVVILICSAIFAGIRWFLRQRTENPTRFESIAAYGGIAFAICIAMISSSGFDKAVERCDKARADVCWSIRSEYFMRLDRSSDKLNDIEIAKQITDPEVIAKAGVRCPDGGTFDVKVKDLGYRKEFKLYCPKHSPYRERFANPQL